MCSYSSSRYWLWGVLMIAVLTNDGRATEQAPHVTAVSLCSAHDTKLEPAQAAALGDRIAVTVCGLKDFITKSDAKAPKSAKRILLVLDKTPIPGLYPDPACDPDSDTCYFVLKWTPAGRDAWSQVLGAPTASTKKIEVSICVEGEAPIGTDVHAFTLQLIPGSSVLGLVFVAATILALLYLAVRTNILRDPIKPGSALTYSLASTQLAWWFVIVLTSYLFVGTITGDFSFTFTGSALVLLGISSGTFVAGRVLPNPDTPDPAKPPAPTPPATNTSSGHVPPAEPTDVAQSNLDKTKVPVLLNQVQKYVFDLLSSDGAVDLHRFQILVWTLVLGVVFIAQVWLYLAMPTFDTNLLALQAVSSGTYLGVKAMTTT
jgi:hypothetical protein